MQVVYKTRKLQKVCEDAEEATKTYGDKMAELIHLRIDQIQSADSVDMLLQFRIGRCHALVGNRKGQYAMDLQHPQRLIFEKKDEQTVEVRILDIEDYH